MSIPYDLHYYRARNLVDGNKAVTASVVNMVAAVIQPPARVVNVWSGNGHVDRLLTSVGYQVHSIDYSADVLRFSVVEPHITPGSDNLKTREQFDLVLCQGLLEHIREECLAATLLEWSRLAPRALVMLESSVRRDTEYTPELLQLDEWWAETFAESGWSCADATGVVSKAVQPWRVFLLQKKQ